MEDEMQTFEVPDPHYATLDGEWWSPSGRLAHWSIEGGALVVMDGDGAIKALVPLEALAAALAFMSISGRA
jgi:hypothetical protein